MKNKNKKIRLASGGNNNAVAPSNNFSSNMPFSNIGQFRIDRVKKIREIYADEASGQRYANRSPSYNSLNLKGADEVRRALEDAISSRDSLVEASKKLYVINPIYASVINYLSNMFMWRYKVTPHKVYTKSKARLKKELPEDDFALIYNLMLEAVDGLSFETKLPSLLTMLFINGGVYITTVCDEESITVDTIILPDKFCRKVAETQYGTSVIEFDFSYFDNTGLQGTELKEYLAQFPKEFTKGYNAYKKDTGNMRWQTLDPHFSTGILLNEMSIPTWFYIYGGLLNYEQYQANELERNANLLRYLVVQTIPHYEDRLLFEIEEVEALQNSMKRIIEKNDNSKLVTTFGDIHVENVGKTDSADTQVVANAFKSIFNNAGFNSTVFTGDSVQALQMSLTRDRALVWRFVQSIVNFYSIAINNWFDFKTYQADIDILPISSYTYNDDIEIYKNNATLGVGKVDYFIASGIKQKNIQDQLQLEKFLRLDQVTPMQTSYTQTAVDREESGETGDKAPKDEKVDGNDKKQPDQSSGKDSKDGGEKPSEIEPAESKDNDQTAE